MQHFWHSEFVSEFQSGRCLSISQCIIPRTNCPRLIWSLWFLCFPQYLLNSIWQWSEICGRCWSQREMWYSETTAYLISNLNFLILSYMLETLSAMLRFKKSSKISDRFYVRQDGTRAYFFQTGAFYQHLFNILIYRGSEQIVWELRFQNDQMRLRLSKNNEY